MTASCTTCRYAEPAVMEGDDEVVLECRRYPPTNVVIADEVLRTWLQVEEADWCGEYEEHAHAGRADAVEAQP